MKSLRARFRNVHSALSKADQNLLDEAILPSSSLSSSQQAFHDALIQGYEETQYSDAACIHMLPVLQALAAAKKISSLDKQDSNDNNSEIVHLADHKRQQKSTQGSNPKQEASTDDAEVIDMHQWQQRRMRHHGLL